MKTLPCKLRRRFFLVLSAAALLACAGFEPARAQEAPDSGAVPGPGFKVGTVTVKFVGAATVNEQVVRANMQLQQGTDFDGAALDRDIRNLYRTGLFEFVQIKWEPAGEHALNLVVEVTPKYRVLAVRYEGNRKVKGSRLAKEVKSRPNTALDERQVKEDSQKIRDYYQKTGYNQVSVTYKVERDRSTGLSTIIFQISEGPRVRISDIRFVGNAHFKQKALRGVMDTKRWWIFSWLTGTGRLKDEQFEDDLDKLRDYYRERGFLDVDIPEDRVTFNYPRPGRLLLTIAISEGRQYHIGDISITGNRLYSSALLKRVVLRQKKGAVFSPSKIEKDQDRMRDFYGRDGYLDTNVGVLRKPNLETGNIDLEYHVQESDKYYVESVEIEGNTKTKSIVILRELALGPGDVFDVVRMKASKLILENTRYFDDVEITPEDTNIPGRRDMRVAVREGRTGSLSFGGGYSSLSRASVFVEIQQTNFDLFNRRSFFQGDGEKFRIRLEIGQLSNEAILSVENPWLFQKRLDGGFDVFRQSSDYDSTFYQQVNLGFDVYLRKRLFEQVDATLKYQYQVIEINDVTPDASPIIQAAAGNNSESSVELSLVRENRDKLLNSTTGNRIEIDNTLVGGPLGGKNNYYKFEFRGSQFFPLFEAQTQVLALIARGGFIKPFGSTSVLPYYDGFYLGGPDDLKGFAFRQVSPRDIFGEPIGGNSYAMFTAEYSVEIVNPMRFAVFYDGGYVNKGTLDFNPFNYQDDFGFGLRLFVLGAPLRLDYGIPLRGDALFPNKQGGQFNFSFGTEF